MEQYIIASYIGIEHRRAIPRHPTLKKQKELFIMWFIIWYVYIKLPMCIRILEPFCYFYHKPKASEVAFNFED